MIRSLVTGHVSLVRQCTATSRRVTKTQYSNILKQHQRQQQNQIRYFGGAMGVKKNAHVEQWNNLREDTHKVST